MTYYEFRGSHDEYHPAAMRDRAGGRGDRAFSAAAKSLGISQPSLSKSIRRIERETGLILFERTTRSLKLTDDGRRLAAVAREVLRDVRHALDQMTAGSGRLTIAALPSIAAPRCRKRSRNSRAAIPASTSPCTMYSTSAPWRWWPIASPTSRSPSNRRQQMAWRSRASCPMQHTSCAAAIIRWRRRNKYAGATWPSFRLSASPQSRRCDA